MGIRALTGRPAVFFDRDGVLNEAVVRDRRPHPPAVLDELELAVGARESLARLARHVPLLFVASNQPDVSRGTQTREAVETMNAALTRLLPITQCYVCYHDDADHCTCRKPLPGLLLNAAREHGVDLRRSYMVGDRWRDVEAGAAAGCTTVLIDRGYQERRPATAPDAIVGTLPQAVDAILEREETYRNADAGVNA